MTFKEKLKLDEALPFEDKVNLTKEIIKNTYKQKDGKIYVAYSGGKDSKVLLHITRQLYPEVLGVFNNTTNEKKEILEYVENTENVKWLLPKKGFAWILKNYGFPMVSKKVCKQVNTIKNPTDKNKNVTNLMLTGFTSKGKYLFREKMSEKWKPLINEDFCITSKCCEILKHKPSEEFQKQSGLFPLTGIMASEGDTRRTEIERSGYVIDSLARPLGFWSEEDIWEYSKRYNLRFAENYYDRYVNGVFVSADKRSGCDLCFMGFQFEITKKRQSDMFYQNRAEKSMICEPKRFEKIMNIENNGVKFKEAMKIVFDYETRK
jgi:3'-phosphoadenosine 5'-phosphosulfate sulfotransferase (PAPS reductase)/FAD synthetase